jgi:hypothetical protein
MTLFSTLLGFLGCDKSTHDNIWAVATGEDNGKPMIIRYRTEIPSNVNIKQYPCLMAVVWKYKSDNENNLPTNTDSSRMYQFEELLEPLEAKKIAFLTVSVTCNGIKEWQWYSNNQDKFMAALNSALSGQLPFPIKVVKQQDPDWSAYYRFKNNIK